MAKVKELLVEHNETTFHDPEKPLTRTNTIVLEIPTTGRPVRIQPRRIAPGRRKIAEDEILKMENDGTIMKSSCTWCSPIVPMRKKDGTKHFCVDYHKLNDVTHKDTYPLSGIERSIDLASGYWQVRVAETDSKKMAFGSHLGLHEFLCMPFGLT